MKLFTLEVNDDFALSLRMNYLEPHDSSIVNINTLRVFLSAF